MVTMLATLTEVVESTCAHHNLDSKTLDVPALAVEAMLRLLELPNTRPIYNIAMFW